MMGANDCFGSIHSLFHPFFFSVNRHIGSPHRPVIWLHFSDGVKWTEWASSFPKWPLGISPLPLLTRSRCATVFRGDFKGPNWREEEKRNPATNGATKGSNNRQQQIVPVSFGYSFGKITESLQSGNDLDIIIFLHKIKVPCDIQNFYRICGQKCFEYVNAFFPHLSSCPQMFLVKSFIGFLKAIFALAPFVPQYFTLSTSSLPSPSLQMS
jgi:hypothetical protein